jgi:hypothetical protein
MSSTIENQLTAENAENAENVKPELDSDVADILNLDQALFDEYLIRNIKTRQSTSYYVIFDTETGKPETYESVVKELKPGITERQYSDFYDNVITNDQCVIEYDFPLVSVKRVLHVKQGGFSIREICSVVSRDFTDIYREQLWVPGVSLLAKDLSVNAFYVFHEPITVPADPNLCVTRIALGVEPKVLTKLKEITEQSKSKGTIKQMMKKITEIAQENAMNAVQAPIIEVEPIMEAPQSLATLADSLPDENEEEDELMNKIVNEILPAVANARPKTAATTVSVEDSPSTNSSSSEDNSNESPDPSDITSESEPSSEVREPAKKRGRPKSTTTKKAPPKEPKQVKPRAKKAKIIKPDDETAPEKKKVAKRAPPKKTTGPKKTTKVAAAEEVAEFGAINDTTKPPPKGGIEDMFSKFQ